MQRTWFERAKCNGCGYLWTTEHNQSVVCACGSGQIDGGILVNVDEVTDELEFKQAVASDLQVNVSELDLIDGSA